MSFSPYSYCTVLYGWLLCLIAIVTTAVVSLFEYPLLSEGFKTIRQTLRSWRERRKHYGIARKIQAVVFLLLLIIIPIITVKSVIVCRYSLPLLTESESDVRELTGEIEQIQSAPIDKPYTEYKDEVQSPKLIRVSGKKLLILYPGEYQVGDRVSVAYLKHSSVVVACADAGTDLKPLYESSFDAYYYIYRTLTPLSLLIAVVGIVFLLNGFGALLPRHQVQEGSAFQKVRKRKPYIISHLVLAAVGAVMLITLASTDLRHGLPLFFKSSFSGAKRGTVAQVETNRCIVRYPVNGETVSGCYVTVDGKQYYTIQGDNVSVGEDVKIRYCISSSVAEITSIQSTGQSD